MKHLALGARKEINTLTHLLHTLHASCQNVPLLFYFLDISMVIKMPLKHRRKAFPVAESRLEKRTRKLLMGKVRQTSSIGERSISQRRKARAVEEKITTDVEGGPLGKNRFDERVSEGLQFTTNMLNYEGR